MDIVINDELASIIENTTTIPSFGNFYHHLLACLGYPYDAPPVADLLRRYHHLEGEWIVISPVHWQATHNDAMIVASGAQLQLSQQESLLWFEQLKEFVASENMQLYFHDAGTWLLQCADKPSIHAKPVSIIQHKSLLPELKNLDNTFYWQRFITENQMFFNTHSLNKDRADLYPINGVWLWGGGFLKEKMSIPIICHDAELHELADLLSKDVTDSQALIGQKKHSVQLFMNLNQHDYQVLQKQVQKNTIRCFWNNGAYQSKSKNWISRFIGRL